MGTNKINGITVCLLILLFYSCKKNDQQPSISNIYVQSGQYVTSELQSGATSQIFDYSKVIQEIKSIKGVVNAFLSSDNNCITVQDNDGFSFNLLLYDDSDISLFSESNSSDPTLNYSNNLLTPPVRQSNGVTPLNKKALILAPFQYDFNQDLSSLILIFQSANYQVTYIDGVTADYTKFTGDFLAQFGIIYISTHGIINDNVPGTNPSTALITSRRWTDPDQNTDPTSLNNKKYLGHLETKNESVYQTITLPYLEATLTQKFPNSLVFVDACESSKNTDLSNFFLKNGAAAYLGYKTGVDSRIADAIGIESMAFFAMGYEITDCFNLVKSNKPLSIVESVNLFSQEKVATLANLSFEKSISLPFISKSDIEIYPIMTQRYGTLETGSTIPIVLKSTASLYNRLSTANIYMYTGVNDVNMRFSAAYQNTTNYPAQIDFDKNCSTLENVTISQSDANINVPKELLFRDYLYNPDSTVVMKLCIPYTLENK